MNAIGSDIRHSACEISVSCVYTKDSTRSNDSYDAYLPTRTSVALADGAQADFCLMPYLLLLKVGTAVAQSRF